MLVIYLQMLETDQERATMTEIHDTYLHMMTGIAMSIVKNQTDAEDAVQQAFLSIIEHFQKVSKMARPDMEAYIVIIVKNKSIDILRARKKISFFAYDDNIWNHEYPAPDTPELASKLAKLPGKYCDVLLLRFYYEFKTKEIAKMLNTTQDNIQKMIWRAKRMLAKEMEKSNGMKSRDSF